ncbi:OmpA family protein [Undibacterium sp. 5I1]|uniref:outer membrane protein OmpA n=1 Tax=unclassified Undibacterium TaxID=2630295 RepID=UPI002AB49B83|nr:MULTISPECIES: OmpA family protein [unclassified Undibacterium]MDY7538745.1 OmpA family protein [Undibacterium sp. 5I1]MEB0229684.1 OmpA family protein [Undibacterium sp. 10I3]MEB0259325.1 OmpA family protein [Undibacterium sp. 5I1]
MKNLVKLVIAASSVAAFSASAQDMTDIKASTPNSAYVQDGRGVIVRDPFGLCWRTGYWTPADAVPGCDAPLVKPAPAIAAAPTPAAVAAPAPAVAVPPAPTSEKVTFAADAFFDFDKAVLKSEAKTKLDDMASKLQGINLEVVIAVGHTDSVGSDAYNQKLSVRRAEAVKAYLVSKDIEANRVYTEGKGKKQPVADNKTAEGRAQNRRVEIEVVGTRNVK